MVLCPDIDRMLIHQATITPTVTTWTHGHQTEEASTTPQLKVKCHIQPESPAEIARAFGEEVVGTHRAFFNSTIAVNVGDQLTQTTGPDVGTLYWVRAVSPWNAPGGQHNDVALELASSSEVLS